jgi:TrmH family RNA methyltransferase
VVAAGLQDPGNLGTVIRSAEAFGGTGLVATDGTVNPYNPKVVRGSAGSLFRLPIAKSEGLSAIAAMRERGLRILATSSHKSTPLPELDLTGPVAILFGNEGAGVPRELLKEADQIIGIPHSSKVESLNAGIAASVVLYECARQRQ